MVRKILVHHNGALGDVLLSLSALQALKEQNFRIHLAGRQDVADLLREFGFISAGLRSDDPLFLSLYTDKADSAMTEFMSGFDGIYIFTREVNSEFARNVRSLFTDAHIVRTVPPGHLRMQVADYRLNQICPGAGIAHYPLLQVPSSHRRTAEAMLQRSGHDFRRPLIAIHPGSGSPKKCWPIERFSEVMNNIRAGIDCVFVLFSGPAEEGDLAAEIEDCRKGLGKDCLHISGAGLCTVASLLRLCDLYIGNDSGITHLASSVMTGRVIAIFGPTDPVLWAPKSVRRLVISSGAECSPCEDADSSNSHRNIPGCGTKCLWDIPADRILPQVKSAL